MPAAVRTRKAQRPSKLQTKQWRDWSDGMNLTDDRTAIDDRQFSWLENAMTIGRGSVQLLNAPGDAIATIAAGPFSIWGAILNGLSMMLSVNDDGSISHVTVPGGVVTQIAPAGTVTTSARVAAWRSTALIIIDPNNGLFSYDGTTFTLVDATKTGTGLAVFESRLWIFTGRTVTFTAPNTFSNFTAGDGAGSFVLTDDAFPGNIIALRSALNQLWIVGQGAIDALSNVNSSGTSPNVVTTFAVTNIVTYLGSNAASSVTGYFRSLALMAPFGAYALAGVTPQKLSDKIDGLPPSLVLTGDVPAAVGVVKSLLCLFYLVTYTGNEAEAESPGPTPLLLGFTQGKWFFGAQGTDLQWITTVIVGGVAEVWGTDGSTIYKCFGAADTDPVKYKVQWRLTDLGSVVSSKSVYKFALEVQASAGISPTITIDTEKTSTVLDIDVSNLLRLINNAGATLQLRNSLNQPLNLRGTGRVLTRHDAPISGYYVGWTVRGEDPPYRIGSAAMQYAMGKPWTG